MVLQMISGVAAPTGRINATTAVLLPIGRLAVRHTPPKSATIFSISLAVRAADRAGYPAMA